MTTEVAITEKECKRCGHKWLPRKASKPRWCPKCNSPYWDRERKRFVMNPGLAKLPLDQRPGRDFWITKTVEQLAEEQGVKPITDWNQLTGYWPEGADFDEFFEAIQSLRKH